MKALSARASVAERSYDAAATPSPMGHDTPVPPFDGYTNDQGGCDIKVTYEAVASELGYDYRPVADLLR